MGADNWAQCPRCVKRAKKDAERAVVDAEKSYGKVPVTEYLRLKTVADAGPDEVARHFREDYEQGVDEDGKLYVIYRGWCQDCGYGVDFRHEAVVPGLDDE